MAELDQSYFTTPRNRAGILGIPKSILLLRGQPGEIREFTAIALTDGVPLSQKGLEYYKKHRTAGKLSAVSRYILKAMIVGDAIGEELPLLKNPHRFLLNPCPLGISPNDLTTLKIIQLYTTFITSSDFNISGESAIRENDKIKVSMVFDKDGRIMLEMGDALSLVEKGDYLTKYQSACQSLSGLFNKKPSRPMSDMTTPSWQTPTQVGVSDASVCEEGYSEFYLMHPLMSDSYPITSPYGPRGGEEHQGTDWGTATGTPIYAAADGVIDRVYAWDGETRQGNSVNIKHTGLGSGYKTKYFHMAQKPTHIKKGDTVSRGDLIGKVGNTGVGTGPHLHMELWKGSAPMDATPFIKAIQKCDDPTAPAVASIDPISPAGTDADEGPIVEV